MSKYGAIKGNDVKDPALMPGIVCHAHVRTRQHRFSQRVSLRAMPRSHPPVCPPPRSVEEAVRGVDEGGDASEPQSSGTVCVSAGGVGREEPGRVRGKVVKLSLWRWGRGGSGGHKGPINDGPLTGVCCLSLPPSPVPALDFPPFSVSVYLFSLFDHPTSSPYSMSSGKNDCKVFKCAGK